ncbi:hypothetical protein AWB67_05631 [Caballeronia terrestris]|uniref:TPR repeat-containing protein n=1 Tax=Caballeronia terrestris TaxID=1226301 RepID=A0A158KH98_9BURK|nr:hypothetical protein [Caballeronia terrestris]SAL80477.1 hypothetical protein AWB67_05631 [Caballeronia terrestris]
MQPFIMNSHAEAFRRLSMGHLDHGLALLSQSILWSDGNSSLDGPFFLGFPGFPGWGEGLLLASLLKRYAASDKKCITVFAPPQICSILKQENAFEVHTVQHYDEAKSRKARSPLAILRHALTGELLQLPFSAIQSFVESEPVDHDDRVGIVWASRNIGGDTSVEKCIPICELLHAIDDGNRMLTSLQRHLSDEESITLRTRFGGRIRFVDEKVLDAEDQTEALRDIADLDRIVTISTTTAHIAACLGIPVMLLAARRHGPQWFWRVQAEHRKVIYPTVTVILGGKGKSWWTPCIPHI